MMDFVIFSLISTLQNHHEQNAMQLAVKHCVGETFGGGIDNVV